ncbi:protein lethal(2)essential for life [Monomorium pharaonis]|uniref:protein lethal(2)essential for life n=1 Tax=Monomorium pharaonis TaxID=307658 RepID=UPI00063F7C26|nr:protein lethal(2)essential for life [Monomorium pharaonis]
MESDHNRHTRDHSRLYKRTSPLRKLTMSVIPLLCPGMWQDFEYPDRFLNQNIGLGTRSAELAEPTIFDPQFNRHLYPLSPYYRPWGNLLRSNEESGISTVRAEKDKFQVILDVQQFKPEEISVKVVDKFVVVEAKHEEKQDEHGWISRQFVRKYMVPEQCDIDQVTSNLSSDGVLSITAPRKDQPKLQNERLIKIEHTGKPAIQEKVQGKEKKEKKKK